MTAPPTKAEMLEQVRVNLIRFMEKYQHVDLHMIAAVTGYSYESIQKYRNGEIVTVPVASAIVRHYPGVGEGIVCPHCKQLVFNYR
jgi:hypothetical protein